MNRFVFMGNYIEKKGNRESQIYYDQVLDKFYRLPYDDLRKVGEGFEYTDEFFSEKFEDSYIREYEITNPDELKALKAILDFKKEKEKVQETFSSSPNDNQTEVIKKENTEEATIEDEKKNKPYKKAIIGSIIVLAACYALYHAYTKYERPIKAKINSGIETLSNKEETKDKYLEKISDAIILNNSIPDDIKTLWINDFTCLFNQDIFMLKSHHNKIVNRLNEGDFSNLNEDNYISTLSRVIFGDDYSIYLGITHQLDDVANKKDRDSTNSILFGYLSLGIDNDLLKETLLLGKDQYINILAQTYDVTSEEIEELTNLLDKYYCASDEDKNAIYLEYTKKVGDILTYYYLTKDKISECDRFILASDIYNRDALDTDAASKSVEINNNLFNEYIIVKVRDNTYGNYNLYFDPESGYDESIPFYRDKIIELFEAKGSNLDYNDPDARFLVYLYVLSYKDTFFMEEKKELFTSETSEDLALHIMRTVFNEFDDVKVNIEFLYGYLSNGKINFDEMFKEIGYFGSDSVSVPLLIEYLRCLNYEVLDGRLSETAYQEQWEKFKKGIIFTDELSEFIEAAVNNDESIFSEFKLPISTLECTSDEIKKYTYEPSGY